MTSKQPTSYYHLTRFLLSWLFCCPVCFSNNEKKNTTFMPTLWLLKKSDITFVILLIIIFFYSGNDLLWVARPPDYIFQLKRSFLMMWAWYSQVSMKQKCILKMRLIPKFMLLPQKLQQPKQQQNAFVPSTIITHMLIDILFWVLSNI